MAKYLTVSSGLQRLDNTVSQSSGVASSDRIIATNSNGVIDASLVTNLANPSTSGGVTTYTQSSRPTTGLNVGDLWKKAGQDIAEFDGTYWVGRLVSTDFLRGMSASSTSSAYGYLPCIGSKILAKRLEVIARVESATPNPSNDFWAFPILYIRGGSSGAITPTISVNNQGISYSAFSNLYLGLSLNQVLDFSSNPNASVTVQRGLLGGWTKNGAAPNLTGLSFILTYQIIYD